MNICILTPRFPIPENGGDVLRINNIARYLKSCGHTLILISFYETEADLSEAYKIYDKIYTIKRNKFVSFIFSFIFILCRKPIQCGYYHSISFKKLFREVIKKESPDLYISHLLRMTPYLEEEKLQNKSIVEMTDALSKSYSLSNNAKHGGIKKIIYNFEKNLISRYEMHIAKTFPKSVLVSATDIDFLNSRSDTILNTLALHTNGVECMSEPVTNYNKNKICFIGNMRTLQNQDAVIHFIDDILPIIKEKIPEVTFHVIGAQPSANILKYNKHDNIVVTGFVDDLYQTISDSCIAVAPIQIAAGIQNKVLMAMSAGIPVVMTSLISHAIPELKDGTNCYICDEKHSFAEKCIKLMTNNKLRADMATECYNMVKRHYSWQEKLKNYELLHTNTWPSKNY